ncbi:hypothetical protein [Mycolicibacterium sp. P9-22]|uniref:hypothetical protein n=1 Tax=Mycolicibacterium sp. P9-22 TaxID=2024613 RepID=UPI0018837FFD|nr:hypothetical protein [Mycolicibacterium sp. P9-22]
MSNNEIARTGESDLDFAAWVTCFNTSAGFREGIYRRSRWEDSGSRRDATGTM